MNTKDVKQILVANYLRSLGYSPIKRQGSGSRYRSPLKKEHGLSFKVNTDHSLQCDLGTGKDGDLIVLVKKLYCSGSLPYLLNRIAGQRSYVHPVSSSFPQRRTESSFQHSEVRDLTHPTLLRYLQGRGINIRLARRECREFHFTNDGKPFFAINSSNMAGGYEVRSSFFKGCIVPKDIIYIQQRGGPRKKCLVFEDFMDYLSFLTLYVRNHPVMPNFGKRDYVIPNPTADVPKILDMMSPCERVHYLLDNGRTRFEATQAIGLGCSYHVRDFSHDYRSYSDLSDYLYSGKQEQKSITSRVQETERETGQRAASRQKRDRGI